MAPRPFDRPVGNSLLHGSKQKELHALVGELQPAEHFRVLLQEFLDQAGAVEQKAKMCGPEYADLGIQIGYALNDMVSERAISIAECMKRMDKNQDGQFSKNEFRTGVRAPINSAVNFGLGVAVDNAALDDYFESVVAEGSGATTVGRSRMMALLKNLRSSALSNIKEIERLKAAAGEQRVRAERAQRMLSDTGACEQELIQLRAKWEAPPPPRCCTIVATASRCP